MRGNRELMTLKQKHPYDDMLLHLRAALKSGVIIGVLWLQGEADSNPQKSAVYLSKLQD